MKSLRVGTRGSLLALKQCHGVLAELQNLTWQKKKEFFYVTVIPIRTEGDKKQDTAQAADLTKKAWVAEIEDLLIRNEIDVIIHSGKDIPHDIAPGTKLISVSKRDYPFDIFIGKKVDGKRLSFDEISAGQNIGTSSKRRKQFLATAKPALNFVEHRGNVNTRVAKLDTDPSLSGIILAEAGIKRIGIDVDYEILPLNVIVPSCNQGILVAQIRENDLETANILELISDDYVEREFKAERLASLLLQADCSTCLGIYAWHSESKLALHIKAVSSKYTIVEHTGTMHDSKISLEAFVHETVKTVVDNGIVDVMNT